MVVGAPAGRSFGTDETRSLLPHSPTRQRWRWRGSVRRRRGAAAGGGVDGAAVVCAAPAVGRRAARRPGHSLLELIAAATRAESVALWVPPHENHDELRCVDCGRRAAAARPRRGPRACRRRRAARGRSWLCPELAEHRTRAARHGRRTADGDDADVQVVAAHATRDEVAPTHDPNHALCCVAVRRSGRTRPRDGGSADPLAGRRRVRRCRAASRHFRRRAAWRARHRS